MHGEPLLDPYLYERIKYAKAIGIPRTYLSTNASLLTAEKGERLIQSGLDSITVCLDGTDSETFESIRIGLDFDTVFQNIKGFMALKKKLHSSTPHVLLQFVATKKNAAQIMDFKAQWSGVVDDIIIQNAISWAGDVELKVDASEPGHQSCDNQKHYIACPNLWRWMIVLSDGSIPLCCLDYQCSEKLGSVENQSLAQIWNGDRLKHIKSLHLKGAFHEIPLCRQCEVPYTSGNPKLRRSFPALMKLLYHQQKLQSTVMAALTRGFFTDTG